MWLSRLSAGSSSSRAAVAVGGPERHEETGEACEESDGDGDHDRPVDVRHCQDGEPAAALFDDSVCWRAVLDEPDLGEIYPTDSENLALQYAHQMLAGSDP